MSRKKPAASFSYILLRGALIRNPVLVQIVGLCPIAAASGDLKTAVLLSAVFSGLLLLTQTLACLYMRGLPRFLRVALYLIIGTVTLCPLLYLLDRTNSSLLAGAQLYFPLLAVSSVTALHCEKLAVNSPLKFAVQDAAATSLGYSAVFLLVGFLRELLGSGQIWGRTVRLPMTFPALLLPFGSFLLLAFLAAGLQLLTRRFFPAHARDARLKISNTPVHLRRSSPADAGQDLPDRTAASAAAPIQNEAPPQAETVQGPMGARPMQTEAELDLLEIRERFRMIMEELEPHGAPAAPQEPLPDGEMPDEEALEIPSEAEESH